MDIQIVHPGANAMVAVKLSPGECVKAEAGAMVAKSEHVRVEGTIYGGVSKSVARKLLGRERFFFQTLTAEGEPGDVLIAPPYPGELCLLSLTDGCEYFVQGGAFVAALGEIAIETEMQRLAKGLIAGEGLFVLRCRGAGTIVVSAYAGLHEIDISETSTYMIDHGHLVAWSSGMHYEVERATDGWMNMITSGESYVCRFSGPGKALVQTRNPHAYGSWLKDFLPLGG